MKTIKITALSCSEEFGKMSIAENYRKLRREVPEHVTIVLACKKRTPEEVVEVIEAGATDLGENYVQEAEKMIEALGDKACNVCWHMIGPLQTNKINKALRLFDLFQTLHSVEQAEAVNTRAAAIGKRLPVFIEINAGEESAKSGTPPDYAAVETLSRAISKMTSLKLEGLMTMGPVTDEPEEFRPFFRKTREIFDRLRKLDLPDTDLKYLSMGMSDSWPVAIEEGSNMIRVGTMIFGSRN